MSRSEPTIAKPIHPFDALATIGCVYLALITAGFAAFVYLNVLPTGASHNRDRAFFSSVNAVTLTGFAQSNAAVPNYPPPGVTVLSILSAAGALTALIGGGYLLARAVHWPISLTKLTLFSIAIVLLPALAMIWEGPFDALSASVGLGLSAQSSTKPVVLAIAVASSTFGTLGVLPLLSLFSSRRADRDPRRYLDHSTLLLAVVVIVGTLLLIACSMSPPDAAIESLALRGFGPTGAKLNASPSLPWGISLLAILGAGPASLAGGLGVFPIVILVRAAIDSIGGRTIDANVGIAIAWLLSFLTVVAAMVLGLAELAPSLSADRLVGILFSAIGNVSASAEPIGLTGSSLFLLSTAMLVGRVLPLVMLAWMACIAERQTASLRLPQSP